MWVCDNCNREFKNINQQHSCYVTDINTHVEKATPELKELFYRIHNELLNRSGVKSSSLKNSILYSVVSNFVSLKVKGKYIEIEIITNDCNLKNSLKSIKLSDYKFVHFFKFFSINDYNKDIVGYFDRAYACANWREKS